MLNKLKGSRKHPIPDGGTMSTRSKGKSAFQKFYTQPRCPSYIKAAKPEVAIPLYEEFLAKLEGHFGKKVERGIFGADMKVSLLNDGPVTIIVDSRLKF